MPRRVVVSREDRARVLRQAVRDDSKVRVSLNGTRTPGPSNTWRRHVKRFVVSPEARAKVLREAVRDDSKVRVSLNGTRVVGPSNATTTRPPTDAAPSRP